jgi:hypothetical protein
MEKERNRLRLIAVRVTSVAIVAATLLPPWTTANAGGVRVEWRFLFNPPGADGHFQAVGLAFSIYAIEVIAILAIGAAIWIGAGLRTATPDS